MKIGFSLGRCVRDIVKNSVDINDVAFIIAATSIHDFTRFSGASSVVYFPSSGSVSEDIFK
jgi:hypothetical protein